MQKTIVLRRRSQTVEIAAAALVLAACAAVFSRPAQAGGEALASPWVQGFNNRVRLVAGAADGSAKIYAGVEIEMPPGWKTYWRSPGEAGGIPPAFDWAGSENLAAAKILYPAPKQMIDKAGMSFGYKDHVLLPVEVTPADSAKPITLRLAVEYGVCNDICIPAEGLLDLALPAGALPPSANLAKALAHVPGAAGKTAGPKLTDWKIAAENGKPTLKIAVDTQSGADTAAFVEAPDGLYVAPPKTESEDGGQALFSVDLSDGVNFKDLKGKLLTVTLVGSTGQTETVIRLD